MSNRLVFLVGAMFVLSLIVPDLVLGAVPTPNVLWWKFDEGSGAIAKDSSGNGRDGVITGAKWKSGGVGGTGSCLEFLGTGQKVEDDDGENYLNGLGAITIAMWVKCRSIPTDKGFIIGENPAGNDSFCTMRYDQAGASFGGMAVLKMAVTSDPGGEQQLESSSNRQTTEWHHVAMTWKDGDVIRFYSNGTEDTPTGRNGPNNAGKISGCSTLIVGQGGKDTGSLGWDGLVDDVRIYDFILTAAQISELAKSDKPMMFKASDPNPADGATGVSSPLFQWKKGDTGVFHNVYLGTTPELTQAELVAPRQPFTMYYHAAGLQPGTTYYWRVDEVEANMTTTRTGDVWSFTVAPTTAYAPSPRNGDKWIAADASLTWQLGQGAALHEVYFSTDKNAVANRDAGAFKGKQAAISFTPGALNQETTYYWAVDEITSAGTKSAGAVWSFTTTSPGGGVKGEYFNGMTPSGVPGLTRIDPTIDFSWGDPGGPGAPIGVDQFSARWTADLEIAVADTYTFITSTDDGVRLWLNEERIIDQWVDQGTTDAFSKAIPLEPGIYPLRMEYYENGGGAVARLFWQTPTVARQIIPAGPLQPPVRAHVLYPPNGDANVPQDVTLTWGAGGQAVQHQVYFGEDAEAVANATADSAGIYKGEQTLDETSFSPGTLEWNKTYYWRVDEVNDASADSPWKGSVWSFTTADFIVVDDFESYNDEPDMGTRIYETWLDGVTNGTTSTVGNWDPPFAEQTIVHSGKQSMPMDYNNVNSPFYAEAEREFAPLQNWKVNDVTDLTLFVRGNQSNGAGTLYVVVEDSTGKTAIVVNPDAGVVNATTWTQWKIPLTDLAGVNLAKVKKLYIGVGDRNSPVAGGAGRIYLDDIRVTKP